MELRGYPRGRIVGCGDLIFRAPDGIGLAIGPVGIHGHRDHRLGNGCQVAPGHLRDERRDGVDLLGRSIKSFHDRAQQAFAGDHHIQRGVALGDRHMDWTRCQPVHSGQQRLLQVRMCDRARLLCCTGTEQRPEHVGRPGGALRLCRNGRRFHRIQHGAPQAGGHISQEGLADARPVRSADEVVFGVAERGHDIPNVGRALKAVESAQVSASRGEPCGTSGVCVEILVQGSFRSDLTGELCEGNRVALVAMEEWLGVSRTPLGEQDDVAPLERCREGGCGLGEIEARIARVSGSEHHGVRLAQPGLRHDADGGELDLGAFRFAMSQGHRDQAAYEVLSLDAARHGHLDGARRTAECGRGGGPGHGAAVLCCDTR